MDRKPDTATLATLGALTILVETWIAWTLARGEHPEADAAHFASTLAVAARRAGEGELSRKADGMATDIQGLVRRAVTQRSAPAGPPAPASSPGPGAPRAGRSPP